MGQNSCLEALGKGMVLALVSVVLPCFLVSTFWDEINAWLNGVYDLPVVLKAKDNFRTGTAVVGKVFAEKVKEFYQDVDNTEIKDIPDSTEHHSFSFRANSPFYWDRAAIADELNQEFGARRRKRMEAFLDYIDEYKGLAVNEMDRAGIPASVTLAQGLLEANAGRSQLAIKGNNHFGIKCLMKSSYAEDGYIADDDFTHHLLAIGCMQFSDDHDYDRFQTYDKVDDSFRHHSLLLATNRYKWLKQYEIGNVYPISRSLYGKTEVPYYAAWSVGLKQSGYATSRKYAEKLTLIIETYRLWKFDYDFIYNRQ